MPKLVTIIGGSGFIGRYIAQRLAHQGWRVRVGTRQPNNALFVKTYGVVGQVEPIFCNIRDDASVREVIEGADVVINCAGTFQTSGPNNCEAVQDDGAERVARIAAEQGASQLIHLSAIGADAESESNYTRTKGEGEQAVLAAYPNAVILRPSVVFGSEDQFFNRFARYSKGIPIIPIAGGDTKFQPVWVEDVAEAAAVAANGEAAPGIYELGGPRVLTFREMMDEMLEIIRVRAAVMNLPWFAARLTAFFGKLLHYATFKIFDSPLSKDQIIDLHNDNVVSADAKNFADLGIEPEDMKVILPQYLWPYRPDGQYNEILQSAKSLKEKRG